MKTLQHQARKRFGQNFLIDTAIIERILTALAPKAADDLIEIGPGRGALTQALLENCRQLTAIELDRDLVAYLSQRFTQAHFTLINADILNVDLSQVAQDLGTDKLRVIGNLPYNITTPLLFHLFQSIAVIADMTVMVQYEVAQRLSAQPGTKAYGRLSVMAQLFCDIRMVCQVPPEAFQPAPKVHSAVVSLCPKITEQPPYYAALDRLVRLAFEQRRKVIRNSLKSLLSETQLHACGVDPMMRPEQLTLTQFVALARLC